MIKVIIRNGRPCKRCGKPMKNHSKYQEICFPCREKRFREVHQKDGGKKIWKKKQN